VVPGVDVQEEIPSMPGVFHLSVDRATEECAKALRWSPAKFFRYPTRFRRPGSGIFRSEKITCAQLYPGRPVMFLPGEKKNAK